MTDIELTAKPSSPEDGDIYFDTAGSRWRRYSAGAGAWEDTAAPVVIPKPRCSSLDRIFACPGSILPADGPKEAGGPDAILGRARHEALSYVPRGIDPPVDEIAARYGVDFDDVAKAAAVGRRAWDEVGQYFPSPLVERKLDSAVCRGTGDVLAAVDGVAPAPFSVDEQEPPNTASPRARRVIVALRLADWKTGYGTDYHPYQLKGYAHCAVEEFGWPANGVVSIFEIWTSHYQVETTNLEREELVEFAAQLAQIRETAEQDPGRLEYRAGAHCSRSFCPHRSAPCEMYAAWMRDSTTALVAVDHGQAITRQILGELYLKGQEVDRAMRRFWAAVDAALDDGPLMLPDGRRVERVETEREKIHTGLAVKALVDSGLVDCGEDEDFLKGDIPKKRLDAFAKRVTVKGGKAALIRKIYKELRGAGAVRTEPYWEKKILGSKGG